MREIGIVGPGAGTYEVASEFPYDGGAHINGLSWGGNGVIFPSSITI